MNQRLLTLFSLGSLLFGAACGVDGGTAGGAGDDSANPSDPGGSDTGDQGDSDQGTAHPDTAVYPAAHPRILIRGSTRTRLKTAVNNQSDTWMRLKATVDDWVAGADMWGFEAWNAAMVGSLTGQSKYCTKAISVVDQQVKDAESAIAAGKAPVVANDSYLDIGSMVGDVALVYDWCNDKVTSSQKTRWVNYMNQAVYNVWHHDTAKWGSKTFSWSGWATDDPSDNYYYSFLRATMLVGLATKDENSQAGTWIDMFRTTKLQNEAWPTFSSDLVGGASREGTGYGQAMRGLWALYDWWHATTGETISLKSQHTRSSMLAFMHQVLPTLDRVAPTGDQARDSTASFFDYHRQYLQELAYLFKADPLAGRATYLLDNSTVPVMDSDFMVAFDFIYDPTSYGVNPSSLSGLNTTYYASGIGELYMRSGWDKHATWVNMIAGPYTESHAHQDQSAIMIYKDGWLAYDPVVDSKSGLRQETNAHGLVRIDSGSSPVHQVADTQSKLLALQTGVGWTYAAADVTAAYDGASAVDKVQREIVYLQPDVVVVYDRVDSSSTTTQTWQLPMPKKPTISGSDASMTSGSHTLHVHRVEPSATASAYSMTSDASGDYTTGYRLDEKVAGGSRRYLHVLSVDGAVSSVTNGTDSATIKLSDGRTAVVSFNANSVGGSLKIGSTSVTLSSGVHTLAE